MVIHFKYKKLVRQWAVLLIKNPALVYICLKTAEEMGGNITITNIFRTKKQQAALYPNNPGKRSVHEYWRGVDIRTRGYSKEKLDTVQLIINAIHPYNKGNIQTIVRHDIGHGDHFHIQNRG